MWAKLYIDFREDPPTTRTATIMVVVERATYKSAESSLGIGVFGKWGGAGDDRPIKDFRMNTLRQG